MILNSSRTFALCFDVTCRSWDWVPRFQNLHLQGPGKLRNIMMGGPGQMGGPSNIMGGPAPPNETMYSRVPELQQFGH